MEHLIESKGVSPGFDTLVRMNKGLVVTNRENRGRLVTMARTISLALDSAKPIVQLGESNVTEYVVPSSIFNVMRDVLNGGIGDEKAKA